jgi:hypothetical protein
VHKAQNGIHTSAFSIHACMQLHLCKQSIFFLAYIHADSSKAPNGWDLTFPMNVCLFWECTRLKMETHICIFNTCMHAITSVQAKHSPDDALTGSVCGGGLHNKGEKQNPRNTTLFMTRIDVEPWITEEGVDPPLIGAAADASGAGCLADEKAHELGCIPQIGRARLERGGGGGRRRRRRRSQVP